MNRSETRRLGDMERQENRYERTIELNRDDDAKRLAA